MLYRREVSSAAARAFARRLLLLDSSAESVSAPLAHLGYVQLDPLNVCGRMHDLILRNRVQGYREGDLLRFIHGSSIHPKHSPTRYRGGFEHYLPGAGILVAWPLDAYPFIRAYLSRRAPRATRNILSTEEQVLATKLIDEITERGPLMSDDLVHEGRATTAWGTDGRLVKVVLEKLFAEGRLLIAERRGFRRVYDLPSRILPELAENVLPSDVELNQWLALLRVRQRRLTAIPRREMELIGHLIKPLRIENGQTLYCLSGDAQLLAESPPPSEGGLQLLAPLDPLIYDRKVTRALWDFDFTWEVYTPPEARKRGYYSLPVLAGVEIIGDIEPRADRKRKRLVVVSRRVKRGYSTVEPVRELAQFLGLNQPK